MQRAMMYAMEISVTTTLTANPRMYELSDFNRFANGTSRTSGEANVDTSMTKTNIETMGANIPDCIMLISLLEIPMREALIIGYIKSEEILFCNTA